MSVTDELCRSYLDLRGHFDPAAASQTGLTALLDDVRASIFRLHYESPHTQNPCFWALHLCQALETASHQEVEEGGEDQDAAFTGFED